MADANTSLYGLVKPEVGASADVWGSKLNNNFDDLDAISGAITTGGSANAYTLTTGLSLAAYVAGQAFDIKTNFANTGAATINVDGLGAKNLTKNGTTALASGDLADATVYRIAYDGTQFQVLNAGGVAQPLDATLTALAALSWSTGKPVVQFTAADTVSLTLTPELRQVTATSTTASTPAMIAKNTADAAGNTGLRLESDRATPANFDQIRIEFVMSDSGGNQDEFARIFAQAAVVTSGSEDGSIFHAVRASGTLTNKLYLDKDKLQPVAAGGALALGSTASGWNGLHLATTTAINWANGNYTLTHSSGALEASGTFRARTALSSETSGTLTAASANKRVKATGGVTINDGVFTAEDCIEIYNDSDSSITITQDTGMTLRLAGTTSTGNRTLAARGVAYVYFDTNADAAVAGSGVS